MSIEKFAIALLVISDKRDIFGDWGWERQALRWGEGRGAIVTLRDLDLSDVVNEAISNYLEMNQKLLAESTKNLDESEVISNYNLAQPYLKNVSHWIRNNCLIFCHND
ncbi:MAG: hypothetical protein ACRCT1_09485 [Microcoleaceae cyanobacterium]